MKTFTNPREALQYLKTKAKKRETIVLDERETIVLDERATETHPRRISKWTKSQKRGKTN